MQKLVLTLFVVLIAFPPIHAKPLQGHHMMVATPTPDSADVAVKIMEKKGNVVDVAVALALTLAVTNPRHAALGGGGFAMIKMGKDPVKALDFRETAPLKTNRDYFKNKGEKASQLGAHAVGVPGIPAGLWALHKKYGKLHWSQLFDIPVALAEKGHRISGENAQRLALAAKDFNKAGQKHFLNKKGEAFRAGEVVQQKALGKALKEMRNRGIKPFYEGQIASDIVKTIQKEGGVLSMDDMKAYEVRWLEPLTTTFKGHTLYLMPPPSSGGLIIAASLKMLEALKADQVDPLSTLEFHYFAEVSKINFRNRNLLGDPSFAKNPTAKFLDDKEIQNWVGQIKKDAALKVEPLGNADFEESEQTTHITVMDAEGNAVAMTITLNGVFGSRIVSEKFGIALNNEMDDFTTRPGEANLFGLVQGKANEVEPGKRPLSSMSPTLVAKNNRVVMALGAPGGPQIITGVLHTLYRVLSSGYNLEEAIFAPRVHHQFRPDKVFIDGRRLPKSAIEKLRKLGHDVEEIFGGARVNGVRLNDSKLLEAAFDYRSEGGAGGY